MNKEKENWKHKFLFEKFMQRSLLNQVMLDYIHEFDFFSLSLKIQNNTESIWACINKNICLKNFHAHALESRVERV